MIHCPRLFFIDINESKQACVDACVDALMLHLKLVSLQNEYCGKKT